MRRPSLRGLVGSLLLLAVALAPRPADLAWAQSATPAAYERRDRLTPEKREELYRELRSQAAVLEAQSNVVKTVAKLIGPTVVHIEADQAARRSARIGPAFPAEEAGAGVIVQLDKRFYVLTNRHVIDGFSPASIRIRLADGREIHPLQIWVDPDTDIGAMSITASDLVAAPIGDSDKMEVGDFVLAVGSPFGLKRSVTFGIISAKGRRDLLLGNSGDSSIRLQDFLQTDAAINPGNSGGPLINLRGEVIGINTAIASNSGGSEGVGFAIPINMYMLVARQLISQGKASRAYLGVTLDQSFGQDAATELGLTRAIGAHVIAVAEQSPAATAHLQKDDVILQFNNTPVDDDVHLVNLVNLAAVGSDASLLVFRNRKTETVRVRLASRTAD